MRWVNYPFLGCLQVWAEQHTFLFTTSSFLTQSFSDENNKNGLKRTDTLDLTQQLGFTQEQGVKDSLRPAFQPDGAVLRKADAIFEKEQEFLLEANTRKPTRQNTELYVNDLG